MEASSSRSIPSVIVSAAPADPSIPPASGCAIRSLPVELMERIFSLVPLVDSLEISATIRDFCDARVDQQLNRGKFFKGIAGVIAGNTKGDLQEKFLAISEDKQEEKLEERNFATIRRDTIRLREEIITALKEVPEGALNELRKENERKTIHKVELNRFIKLANIYKIIDMADNDSDYEAIVMLLINANHLDKALEIAKMITKESTRENAIASIADGLCEKGNFKRSLDVAQMITDKKIREQKVLCAIVRRLCERDDFVRALEIAQTITKEWCRGYALGFIAHEYFERDDFDRALEIAKMITDEGIRNTALSGIAKGFYRRDDFDRASEIQKIISKKTDEDWDF